MRLSTFPPLLPSVAPSLQIHPPCKANNKVYLLWTESNLEEKNLSWPKANKNTAIALYYLNNFCKQEEQGPYWVFSQQLKPSTVCMRRIRHWHLGRRTKYTVIVHKSATQGIMKQRQEKLECEQQKKLAYWKIEKINRKIRKKKPEQYGRGSGRWTFGMKFFRRGQDLYLVSVVETEVPLCTLKTKREQDSLLLKALRVERWHLREESWDLLHWRLNM